MHCLLLKKAIRKEIQNIVWWHILGECVCGGGGGGGGRRGVTWVWLWYGCASQYFRIYPIQLPSLWKKRTHSYSWSSEMLTYSYTALWFFCTHFLLVVRQIPQSIHWIPREQAVSKNLWANICAYTRMSEMWGLSHRNPEKSGHSYTFCWKRGPIIYLVALKKGAIRHAHPHYFIFRKLPSPPTRPPPLPHNAYR